MFTRRLQWCVIRAGPSWWTGYRLRDRTAASWVGFPSLQTWAADYQGGHESGAILYLYWRSPNTAVVIWCWVLYWFELLWCFGLCVILLVAPTTSSMCKILSLWELFASGFNIQFNVQKSKCMLVCASKRQSLQNFKSPVACQFYIRGKQEFVDRYSHLGHIITNTSLRDSQDIIHRCGCLIGQINGVLFWKIRLAGEGVPAEVFLL